MKPGRDNSGEISPNIDELNRWLNPRVLRRFQLDTSRDGCLSVTMADGNVVTSTGSALLPNLQVAYRFVKGGAPWWLVTIFSRKERQYAGCGITVARSWNQYMKAPD